MKMYCLCIDTVNKRYSTVYFDKYTNHVHGGQFIPTQEIFGKYSNFKDRALCKIASAFVMNELNLDKEF